MSILNWIFRKPVVVPAEQEANSSGLVNSGNHATPKVPASAGARELPDTAIQRRELKHAKREKLFSIVRESMTRVGLLSSGYKFKVLSLDSRGRQFIVMIDVSPDQASMIEQLADIEMAITTNAGARFGIEVPSVYWRANVNLSEGLVMRKPSPKTSVKPRYEPLADDEVVAFKRALAGVPVGDVPHGVEQRSVRRNPAPEVVSEVDVDFDDLRSPLSTTQYGDLN